MNDKAASRSISFSKFFSQFQHSGVEKTNPVFSSCLAAIENMCASILKLALVWRGKKARTALRFLPFYAVFVSSDWPSDGHLIVFDFSIDN